MRRRGKDGERGGMKEGGWRKREEEESKIHPTAGVISHQLKNVVLKTPIA